MVTRYLMLYIGIATGNTGRQSCNKCHPLRTHVFYLTVATRIFLEFARVKHECREN